MPRTIIMPSAEDIDRKWIAAIPKVPAEYLAMVEKTTGFKERAIAGEGTYGEVMTRVIAEKRRAKGLEKITDEDWKRGVREKGAKRIGPGMEAGKAKRRAKYEPFRVALHGLEIPDKGPDPVENARVIVPIVVDRLVKTKREILGI